MRPTLRLAALPIAATAISVSYAVAQNEGMGVLHKPPVPITPEEREEIKAISSNRQKVDLKLESNSDKLTPETQHLLVLLGKAIKDADSNDRLLIAGHSDGRGTQLYNQQLS